MEQQNTELRVKVRVGEIGVVVDETVGEGEGAGRMKGEGRRNCCSCSGTGVKLQERGQQGCCRGVVE